MFCRGAGAWQDVVQINVEMARQLLIGEHRLDLSRPRVMGVLNLTPDSFSDGGRFVVRDIAVAQAERMVAEGASVIDIGGESTRPGARAVGVQEELDRVLPIIEAVRELGVPLSVDTAKPEVMREAIRAGAALINDVRALRVDGALQVAAGSGAAVCLMHMQGEPRTMQDAPYYEDVLVDVKAFLAERIAACEQAGIERARLLIDPGFGFGKTLAHNLTLAARLESFAALDVPVLIGVSRKSMIGTILNAPVDQRMIGSVTLALLLAQRGAAILRVHDVAETVQALQIWEALESA